MEKDSIVRLENITKRFGGVTALNNVSLETKRGEVHAVVGENGAGKSTMMKILAGIHPPDSGKIFLRGEVTRIDNPRVARALGISIVFQELNLFPHLTVADNIFVNRELFAKTGLLDERRMHEESKGILGTIGACIDTHARVGRLPHSQKQLVEIARALHQRADIIIMDEPNSALSEQETRVLFEIIRRLRDQGITILYVSHRLEEVFQIADRISVLRDGHYMGTWDKAETSVEDIIAAMIGRKLDETFPQRLPLPADRPVALQVLGLSKVGKFEPINFQLHQGEVLGFAGLEGCGIEDIFHVLFGLEKPSAGEIRFDNQVRIARSPDEAIRWGWALIPSERRAQGLMMDWSVKKNVSLVILTQLLNRLGLINDAMEKQLVGECIGRYRIATDSMDKRAIDLSGGNQQKVVVAKWLAAQPQVLILNDPTRGIDVGAKAEIYALINQLAEDGLVILFTSSEIDEILGICDRILVLYKGRLVKEFQRGEATKAEVMSYVAGGVVNSQVGDNACQLT